MGTTVGIVALILLGTHGFFASISGEPATQALFSSPSLPDNPCDVLTSAELSRATGLEVTSIRREPRHREGRAPEAGMVCSYETSSDFGTILLAVLPRSERRSSQYWEARSKHFETFSGSAQHIEGLGIDAWLAAGNSLSVLVRENESFWLSTCWQKPGAQWHRPRELLVELARAILRKYQP